MKNFATACVLAVPLTSYLLLWGFGLVSTSIDGLLGTTVGWIIFGPVLFEARMK